jgi:branched-chain amino acid transport system ATP-binding protein
MMPLLKLDNVSVNYGAIQAVRNIDMEVNGGEIVTLIGANGAGKTTILRSISRMLKAREGSIQFNGEEITGMSPDRVVRMGIAQCPEGRQVLARQSVRDNLELGAYVRKDRQGIQQDIARMFERFPILAQREKQLAGTLSGGEQQMLAMARALMSRPKLLLLDEPSLGLAPLIVLNIFNIIKELNSEGVTILLVEQNARLAMQQAHRTYVIEAGQITLSGNSAALLDDERVLHAYLGS